jgi:multiple sugar transport system substrate-binding protein
MYQGKLNLRRRILAGVVGLVSIAALGACSGGSVTGSSASGGGRTQINIWWDYTAGSATAAQDIVTQFNGSQDKYQAVAQFGAPSDQFDAKLINAVKNGQGPNLVIGDSTPQNIGLVTETGKVLPLDSYLSDPSSTITKSNFTPGMLSTGTFKGTLYTLPTDIGDYAIVYNKKMFADAGITSTPTTWSELAADAAKLTKGTTQYGIYLPISSGEWPVFTWQSMLWGAGGEFLNSDNTKAEFNSQAGIDALSAWVDLIKSHNAYPQSLFSSTNNGGTAALTAQKVAMAYDGAYNLGTLDKALGADNVGVFAAPGLKQPGMNLGTDNSYLLKGTTATEQGSWQFLQYWLKPSVQATWDVSTGYFPSNSDTSNDPTWKSYLEKNPRIPVFVKELEYAKARPSITSYSEVSNALSQELTAAMMGQSSPADALNAAATKAQGILDKAGK